MSDKKKTVRLPSSPMNNNERVRQIASFAEGGMEDLQRYAGGSGAKEQKLIQSVIAAHKLTCMESSYVAGCNPVSHFQFMALACMLKLVPGKAGGGKLWAVPFKGAIAPIIGHKGFMALWHRLHPNDQIVVRLVYSGETATRDQLTGAVEHDEGDMFADKALPDVIGGYCFIRDRKTGVVTAWSEPYSLKRLLARARTSQSHEASRETKNPDDWTQWWKSSSAWATWPQEMLQKTIIRAFFSSASISLENAEDLQRAIVAEDAESKGGDGYQSVLGIETPAHEIPNVPPDQNAMGAKPRGVAEPTGRKVEYGKEHESEDEAPPAEAESDNTGGLWSEEDLKGLDSTDHTEGH